MASPAGSQRLAVALTAFLAADAVACAIPVKFVEDDLIRLGCPPGMRRTIPYIKGAAAAGMAIGFANRGLGRLTAKFVVLYFVLAVAAHLRVRDALVRYVPAFGLLAVSIAVAAAAYEEPSGT